jgi:hypothetical protein
MPRTKKTFNNTGSQPTPKEISWRAAEYDYYEKDLNWYLLVGALALLLIIVALWQKDFFFAVFILLSSTMVIILGRQRPEVLDFRLTEEGCHLGAKLFYPYDALENFSITERSGRLDEMVLKRKTAFNPYIRVLLDNQTATKVREFLKDKLPEVEREETFMDIFTHLLGF